jgi:hypothetical protein
MTVDLLQLCSNNIMGNCRGSGVAGVPTGVHWRTSLTGVH